MTTKLKSPEVLQRSKVDFEVTFFRASGAGGQNRNKNDTACRIKDKKTGLQSDASDSKSQAQNKKNAFIKLAKKIIAHYEALESQDDERETNLGWAEKIRTYHQKRNMVTDHRTGVSLPYDRVLNGEIEEFIKELKINEN